MSRRFEYQRHWQLEHQAFGRWLQQLGRPQHCHKVDPSLRQGARARHYASGGARGRDLLHRYHWQPDNCDQQAWKSQAAAQPGESRLSRQRPWWLFQQRRQAVWTKLSHQPRIVSLHELRRDAVLGHRSARQNPPLMRYRLSIPALAEWYNISNRLWTATYKLQGHVGRLTTVWKNVSCLPLQWSHEFPGRVHADLYWQVRVGDEHDWSVRRTQSSRESHDHWHRAQHIERAHVSWCRCSAFLLRRL